MGDAGIYTNGVKDEVTEDLGYYVERVPAHRVAAEQIDGVLKKGAIGESESNSCRSVARHATKPLALTITSSPRTSLLSTSQS